jgi:hypothetical protein
VKIKHSITLVNIEQFAGMQNKGGVITVTAVSLSKAEILIFLDGRKQFE